MRLARILAAILLASWEPGNVLAQSFYWNQLADGLELGDFPSPVPAESGDSRITILRINPRRFEFRLLCATEHEGRARTLSSWAEEFKLVAAVNAGMFQEDHLTSVGYLRNYQHVNNGYLNKNNTLFAFAVVDSSLPPAQIVDRTCQDFAQLRDRYQCWLQSIRMISCRQNNVWEPQDRKGSMAVLGADKFGNILFIFSRSPYSAHELGNILLSLPIALYNAMYLEGGTPAAFYLSTGDYKVEMFGGFEDAFINNEKVGAGWVIPNVLGIVPAGSPR